MIVSKLFRILLVMVFVQSAYGQSDLRRKLIIVTLDGLRWQEVFKGVDHKIVRNRKYVTKFNTIKPFISFDQRESRELLMPFMWSVIGNEGQLYGNRAYQNNVNCRNPYWFSYPGYSELFVGAVDRKVCTNNKVLNPNETVLDFINKQPEYHNSIAAFTTWDVFPFILRESVNGISVNAGVEDVSHRDLTKTEVNMNEHQQTIGHRSDSITFQLAFEHLKQRRPEVLYIGFDETDDYSHKGKYDNYLEAVHKADQWLSSLWQWVQSDAEYANNTTLILTADHGRGKGSKAWKSHGRLTFGSSQIWIAVVGPDTPPRGEMKLPVQLYQKQIASTMAMFLRLSYESNLKIGAPISSMTTGFGVEGAVAGK